jgi:hypothetical protein
MVRHRAAWGSLAFSHTSVIVAATLAWGLSACSKSSDGDGDSEGSGNSANADDCYSCGAEACPAEATKCDELPVCATLRDCTLDCVPTDAKCKTDCTAAAVDDNSAVVAGAAFIACATTNCPDECVGSPSTTTTGTTSGSPSQGGGGGDLCQQLSDWAAGCSVDVSGQIPDCSVLDAAQECIANCIVNASCADFQGASSGTQNAFTTCMTDCVSGGGSPTGVPTTSDPPSTAFTVAPGGYVTSGTWQGFAWTGTDTASGSMIQPADYSAALGGAGLCASGTVAGTSDFSAVAMIGISLNQPNTDPTPAPGSWTPPSGSLGVGYEVSNFLGVPLRIQIQAPGGDTNANLRYCAEASNGAGTLSWSRFNTKCWDGTGTNYDGTSPLESIMLLVPGDKEPTSFDVCLQSISPQ